MTAETESFRIDQTFFKGFCVQQKAHFYVNIHIHMYKCVNL